VVDCGRRFGKSKYAGRLLAEPALDGYPVAYFAPTYKMLFETWQTVKRYLKAVTPRGGVSEQMKRLDLITGGVVECWSMDDPDAGRSRKYKRAIVDEAAKVRKLREAWTESVRPTLSDLEGDAYFFSTPKGLNYFHELYNFGVRGEPDWQSFQFSTYANPYIKRSEVDAAKRDLPERVFLQEYMAVFLELAGAVFRNLSEAATAGWQDTPESGHDYAIGVDFAKLNDYSVFSVIDLTRKEQCHLVRLNQISYMDQLKELKDLINLFNPISVIAESNSVGEALIDVLEHDAVPVTRFVTTAATKKVAIEDLAYAIESLEFRILDHAIQTAELLSYEIERTGTGGFRYGPATNDMHDDTVMALAIGYTAVPESGPLLLSRYN
jgi:hypothetical protein